MDEKNLSLKKEYKQKLDRKKQLKALEEIILKFDDIESRLSTTKLQKEYSVVLVFIIRLSFYFSLFAYTEPL